MSRRIDPTGLEAWSAFLHAHAAVLETLQRELQDEQALPLPWYEVLLHLRRAPGGRLRMQELANSILLSQSGVSRLVDRMERAGLVERTSCATDGRGTFAQITTLGRDALRRAAPTHLRGIDEHFLSHLSQREMAAVRTAMAKIAAANARNDAGLTQPGSSAPAARRPASRPRAPARRG